MFGGTRWAPSVRWTILAAALLAAPSVALAQPGGDDEVSAADRQAAAEAYDRGSSAYLSHHYEQAARYFETADRFAPSAAALVQAIRAHRHAGNELRAANLALRLKGRHSDEAAAQRTADRVLSSAEGDYFRVEVQCDGCTVLVDGAVLDWPTFFIEPDTERTVTAHFETGDREQVVQGPAGESQQLAFEAPPPPLDEPEPEPNEPTPATPQPVEPVEGGGGLSSTWFFLAGAATVVAGGLTTWSGVDALAGVDAYEQEAETGDPAEAQRMLEEGQNKELRTNVLIGVTAGLAAVTVILAALTDWSGEPDQERDPNLSASVGVVPDGAEAVIGGTF